MQLENASRILVRTPPDLLQMIAVVAQQVLQAIGSGSTLLLDRRLFGLALCGQECRAPALVAMLVMLKRQRLSSAGSSDERIAGRCRSQALRRGTGVVEADGHAFARCADAVAPIQNDRARGLPPSRSAPKGLIFSSVLKMPGGRFLSDSPVILATMSRVREQFRCQNIARIVLDGGGQLRTNSDHFSPQNDISEPVASPETCANVRYCRTLNP